MCKNLSFRENPKPANETNHPVGDIFNETILESNFGTGKF
jgi:hypothetical protein